MILQKLSRNIGDFDVGFNAAILYSPAVLKVIEGNFRDNNVSSVEQGPPCPQASDPSPGACTDQLSQAIRTEMEGEDISI